MAPDELTRLLERAALPSKTLLERQLDRSDIPPDTNQAVVWGKGATERIVHVTDDARAALDDYLEARNDCDSALFVSCDGARPAPIPASLRHRKIGD